MDLKTTQNLPTRGESGGVGTLSQKSTRDIIRSAFNSIQLPSTEKRKTNATAGEEALFAV